MVLCKMFHAPSYPIEALTHDSSHESTISFVSQKKKKKKTVHKAKVHSIIFIQTWKLLLHVDAGKNSQIPLFFEIISILPLFKKYVAIIVLKLEFDIELEFTKIEFLKVYRTWVPCDI